MNFPTLNIINFAENGTDPAITSGQQPIFKFGNVFDSKAVDESITIKNGETETTYARGKTAGEGKDWTNADMVTKLNETINRTNMEELYGATFVYNNQELYFDPDAKLDGRFDARPVTLLDVLDSTTTNQKKQTILFWHSWRRNMI